MRRDLLILVVIGLIAVPGPGYARKAVVRDSKVALTVRHTPNPVTAVARPDTGKGTFRYTWKYKTDVTNNLDIPLRITEFRCDAYNKGEWMIFPGAYGTADFTKWYTRGDRVVDGRIRPGGTASDANNWNFDARPVPSRLKWVYIAQDSLGRSYRGESEIECIPYMAAESEPPALENSSLIRISGSVIGIDGKPPAYVQLRLAGVDGDYQKPLQTMSWKGDGSFSLAVEKPGWYRLFVYAPGCDDVLIPLNFDAQDRAVSIEIRPAPHDYVAKSRRDHLPRVTFREANPRLERIWNLYCDDEAATASWRRALEKWQASRKNGQDFSYDLPRMARTLRRRMERDSDIAVRQYAALLLAQLPVALDSTRVLEIFALLPPSSAIWSAAPYSPFFLARRCDAGKEKRLMRDFAENSPDRIIRAQAVARLGYMARDAGEQESVRGYYRKLKSEYGDVPNIRDSFVQLNPDRAILPGKRVPHFEVRLLDGKETISDETMRGRYYLIDFWATWCGFCVADMPYLHKAYAQFKGKNFTILSLSIDAKPEEVAAFRKRKWKMPWLNAHLEGGGQSEIANRFELGSLVPTVILVGPDGVILREGMSLRGKALRETVGSYLGN